MGHFVQQCGNAIHLEQELDTRDSVELNIIDIKKRILGHLKDTRRLQMPQTRPLYHLYCPRKVDVRLTYFGDNDVSGSVGRSLILEALESFSQRL